MSAEEELDFETAFLNGIADRPTSCDVERSLSALQYHIRVAGLLLQKLDLPFGPLQQLNLGVQRARPVPVIRPPSGRDDLLTPPHNSWRSSPWGALYLCVRSCCPLWSLLAALKAPEELPAEHKKPGEVEVSRDSTRCSLDDIHVRPGRSSAAFAWSIREDEGGSPSACAFACLSSEEASTIAESEAHICAALQHLANASAWESAVRRASAAAAAADASAAMAAAAAAKVAEEVTRDSQLQQRQEESTSPDLEEASVENTSGSASPSKAREETAASEETSDSVLPLPPAYVEWLQKLQEIIWAFWIRARLAEALLEGEPLRAAAWAVRCLGLGEPWGLKKIQELVAMSLESAAETLTEPGYARVPTGASMQTSGIVVASADEPLRAFQEACSVYLGVPVIPRFEARVRRCVSDLSERGAFSQSRPRGDSEISVHDTRLQAALDEALAKALRLEQGLEDGDAPATRFDDAGKSLEAFRSKDWLYVGVKELVLRTAARHRRGNRCSVNTVSVVAAGAEAALRMRAGGDPWPQQRQRDFKDAMRSLGVTTTRGLQPPEATEAARSAKLREDLQETCADVLCGDTLAPGCSSSASGRAAAAGPLPILKNLCCSTHKEQSK
eukprot:TRINITY_DN80968_c0_g1_i1.p1 TRINITY_DN80968_c0_g1~~TRINITY_DN80968_c0_g1_i1.p1  ORF type:complete len:616 (+),score=151.95 TRINITY_DN80968_c0_g1_i1:82-1929(+)